MGLLQRFQRKVRYESGIGVVISAGVYRRLIGKILLPAGVVNIEGLKGSIPRPFVVVHSGKIAIIRVGFLLISVSKSTRVAVAGGALCGVANALRIAWRSDS